MANSLDTVEHEQPVASGPDEVRALRTALIPDAGKYIARRSPDAARLMALAGGPRTPGGTWEDHLAALRQLLHGHAATGTPENIAATRLPRHRGRDPRLTGRHFPSRPADPAFRGILSLMAHVEHAADSSPGFLAWDHNTYYQSRLLRALPRRCARVLDVGCGAGAFAARLAERADQVDALDVSPEMIMAARRTVPGNVTCVLGDVREITLPAGAYDAITSISALHHMPLSVVLPRLAAALRPGGVLIAVAHYRPDYPRDLLAQGVSLLAVYGRRVILLPIPRARKSRRELDETGMPVKDPELTVREVQRQAADALPGAEVRRLMLWRYQIAWRKPATSA